MRWVDLSPEDAQLLKTLCGRAGLARVLKALADRCAAEAYNPGAPRERWEEAFHAIRRGAELVAELTGQ